MYYFRRLFSPRNPYQLRRTLSGIGPKYYKRHMKGEIILLYGGSITLSGWIFMKRVKWWRYNSPTKT